MILMTHIILNPKVKKPATMGDLRPISLFNVVYKIIVKILANRLKFVLLNIIDPSQSVFILGQNIIDKLLIGFKCIHYFKRCTQGHDGYVPLKLDMSKAYDCLEWPYLHMVLELLGFPTHFVSLIMLCISSVCYNVLHNRKEFGPLIPSRGLCQGCPLSPYLFILCRRFLCPS